MKCGLREKVREMGGRRGGEREKEMEGEREIEKERGGGRKREGERDIDHLFGTGGEETTKQLLAYTKLCLEIIIF